MQSLQAKYFAQKHTIRERLTEEEEEAHHLEYGVLHEGHHIQWQYQGRIPCTPSKPKQMKS